jgi:uncharacterized repeat protein (TIGR03837 family)
MPAPPPATPTGTCAATHAAPAAPGPLRWDVYCRVIDNHGDLGVCWRLAADLAGRGDRVRLFVDDASALAWMAPQGCAGVQVRAFDADAGPESRTDVVVEAFGCDPPPARVHRLATAQAAGRGPAWINLEYLSAETYVERSHGLPSPQPGGASKWFFYPGFTPATGGLLRGPGWLMPEPADAAADDPAADAQAAAAVDALAVRLGLPPPHGERWVSLFCYADPPPPLAAWLADLAATTPAGDRAVRVLLTPGPAQALAAALRPAEIPPGLRLSPLPWLPQAEYDRLLGACALNAVRGEDSLVRAIWAGRPWLWHIYPQHDGAHADKLDALLQRLLAADPGLAAGPLGRALPMLHRAWNGLATTGPGWRQEPAGRRSPAWPGLPSGTLWDDWARLCRAWRRQLAAQSDLTTQLRAFAADRLAPGRSRPGPHEATGPSSPGC